MRLIVTGTDYEFYGWDVTCLHCHAHLSDDERHEDNDEIVDVPCPVCGGILRVAKIVTTAYNCVKP